MFTVWRAAAVCSCRLLFDLLVVVCSGGRGQEGLELPALTPNTATVVKQAVTVASDVVVAVVVGLTVVVVVVLMPMWLFFSLNPRPRQARVQRTRRGGHVQHGALQDPGRHRERGHQAVRGGHAGESVLCQCRSNSRSE